mmetsp:Transcript_14442/g.24208  ORF Transcript_14442/g.24208 Transcript_14442/m.24208 type:complete len:223 (-) Transcript_14442:86-754(-)
MASSSLSSSSHTKSSYPVWSTSPLSTPRNFAAKARIVVLVSTTSCSALLSCCLSLLMCFSFFSSFVMSLAKVAGLPFTSNLDLELVGWPSFDSSSRVSQEIVSCTGSVKVAVAGLPFTSIVLISMAATGCTDFCSSSCASFTLSSSMSAMMMVCISSAILTASWKTDATALETALEALLRNCSIALGSSALVLVSLQATGDLESVQAARRPRSFDLKKVIAA